MICRGYTRRVGGAVREGDSRSDRPPNPTDLLRSAETVLVDAWFGYIDKERPRGWDFTKDAFRYGMSYLKWYGVDAEHYSST